jgi:hypothetical protein
MRNTTKMMSTSARKNPVFMAHMLIGDSGLGLYALVALETAIVSLLPLFWLSILISNPTDSFLAIRSGMLCLPGRKYIVS